MKRALAGLAVVTVIAVSAPVLAQNAPAREANQQARIAAGVATGQLSKGEAHRLHQQQRRIKHAERRMRARNGGHLSPRQRAKLDAAQDKASADIHAAKHN